MQLKTNLCYVFNDKSLNKSGSSRNPDYTTSPGRIINKTGTKGAISPNRNPETATPAEQVPVNMTERLFEFVYILSSVSVQFRFEWLIKDSGYKLFQNQCFHNFSGVLNVAFFQMQITLSKS
ncbi:hypothetical protein [Gimesia sp.]|uniref:hypothetical protein n=1 Tax=Gimesia sp. TaxID=2024833 RepID=UPI003A90C796